MFNDHIEESGDNDARTNNTPYEIEDEEMEQLSSGGPATDDSFAVEKDPADPQPDDQDTRHIGGAAEQVADVDTKEWEDSIAAEEREKELDVLGKNDKNTT